MRLLTSFGGALVALALSVNFANAAPLNATAICKLLERHGELSNGSSVYWPGTPQFDAAIFHDSAASTQQSTCVIEPATPRDVGKTLVIIGGSRVPFAVKGGGHAVNPGFSSTLGVHISLEKFNQVVYDANSVPGAPNGRVTYGAALSWGEVYNALDPFNVTVAGGRIPTVGAAGLTLGGGYSFYSNQHGMTVDNILSFELVKPNGIVENVTARSNPDLFWALKGGGNNFGIVTRFTIRAIPYSRVWGGPAYYFGSLQEMADAYLTFCQTVTDPKAVVLPSFGMLNGTPTAGAMLFYDGPEPPPNMFDAFTNLPNPVFKDLTTRTVGNFLAVAGANPATGLRNGFGTLTAPAITREYLDAVVAEVQTVAALNPAPAIFNFSPQFFLKSYLKNPARTSDSAYPPKSLRDAGGSPMSAYWTWTNAADDASIRAAMAASAARLQTVVTASTGGGPPLVVYPNYAPAATPLERMYGAQNVARLKSIARSVDPLKIMKLAGGWKFQ